MSTKVNIPDFDFSGFYYGEILESLLDYMRRNVPEISNTSPYEPAVQIMRAYALVGHLNNTLLDMTANESMLSSAQLRESVVRLLALIGYTPKANIPAQGYVRVQLTKGYGASTLIVPDNALFGTKRRADTPAIVFESDLAISTDRTDQLIGCFDVQKPAAIVNYDWVDETANANANATPTLLLTGGNTGAPGGTGPIPGATFYVGHGTTLTDAVEFTGITAPFTDWGDSQPSPTGGKYGAPFTDPIWLWEYFDGELEDAQPDAVTVVGSGLNFKLDHGLLGYNGDAPPRDGLWVRVTYTVKNISEWVQVEWDYPSQTNSITTTGYLGQTVPSLAASDYNVGSYWHEIPNITDNTMAPIEVVDEVIGVGDGFGTTIFPDTLDRYPIEEGSILRWSYDSGGLPKNASLDTSDGTLGGDADIGTTYNNENGQLVYVAQNAPDGGSPVLCTYKTEPKPFQQDGKVMFKVPMTATEDWRGTRLDDSFPPDNPFGIPPNTSGYWIRFRLVQMGQAPMGAAPPVTCDRVRWDSEKLYMRVPVTQGRTYSNEIAGSGTGAADQSFKLQKTPVIESSVRAFVDGTEWEAVEDFVSSDATDQVFRVTIDSDGFATVLFGDGTNGKTATSGANNVTAEYRVGGKEDGNVGSSQITVNRSGLSRVRSIINPRSLSGWQAQEGSASEDSLEKLKRDGVASLRVLNRAVTPADYEYLSTRWVDEGYTNQQPFTRCRAIENGYGPKTLKLICVPNDGIIPSSGAVRERMEIYFNGDTGVGGVEEGVGLVNTEVGAIDYTPVSFPIQAEITGGDKDKVQAALYAILQPEALEDDGQTYRWGFGETITTSRLISLIFLSDDKVRDVTLTLPATATYLDEASLPRFAFGDISITEVI